MSLFLKAPQRLHPLKAMRALTRDFPVVLDVELQWVTCKTVLPLAIMCLSWNLDGLDFHLAFLFKLVSCTPLNQPIHLARFDLPPGKRFFFLFFCNTSVLNLND